MSGGMDGSSRSYDLDVETKIFELSQALETHPLSLAERFQTSRSSMGIFL
jgi:hypothetical protein